MFLTSNISLSQIIQFKARLQSFIAIRNFLSQFHVKVKDYSHLVEYWPCFINQL